LSSKARPATQRPSWLALLTRRPRDRDRLLPLYQAVVAAGRDPFWYREGQVPDSVDGRFDLIAAITAMVLVRLEAEQGEEAAIASVHLTELFIEDMDESLRQIGIGDYVVGKHVGRMVGALGGRLAAFRRASLDGGFEAPVRRNIYHEAPPAEDAARLVTQRLERFDSALRETPLDRLIEGHLPPP
jgi:cytochrome b pre-mRNA-processing protein 3